MESPQLFNPLFLHLQKLSLELKCPMCFELLEFPNLLPCQHIFCSSCLKNWNMFGYQCPACKCKYIDAEVKPAPFVQNVVNIYKSMTLISLSTVAQPISRDVGNSLNLCPVTIKTNSVDEAKKGICPATDGNSSSGTLSANNGVPDIVNAEGNKLAFNVEARSNQSRSHVENANVKCKGSVANEIDVNQTGQLSPGCTHMLGSSDDNNADPWTCRDAKRHKSNPEDGNGVCVFCHSSEVSDVTGKMLHYANGKEVVGDVKCISNSMHVHQICIDWTPQVYYEGDNIINLESELARASKLKCTECGLKGAGLGCYMKSCRRSYHVTCALKTSDCKWDFNDFIMMCPTHKAVKFPSEKTKSRKGTIIEAEPPVAPTVAKQAKVLSAAPSGGKELVVCGSFLSKEEKSNLDEFVNTYHATVSKSWTPNVTHVIAAVDAKGEYTRTIKVLMAILNGKWVVTMDWIKACNEANKLVDEEPYEAGLDKHGSRDGPKIGRLKALQKAPKLFSGLMFYFGADFTLEYKEDLIRLVTAGGGLVIKSKEEVGAQSSNTLIIYNDKVKEYTLAAEELAEQFGCGAHADTWILECIASCKLVR